jgi:hypothetical protein
MNEKWAYDVIPFPEKSSFSGCSALIDKLNVMGSNGWELVSIINHPDPDKFYTNSKNPFFAILKKPIS